MPGEPISFEADVKPLFRERDQRSMKRAFDLWAYEDVKTHSAAILEAVSNGSMPCDGEWPPASVATLQSWIDADFPA